MDLTDAQLKTISKLAAQQLAAEAEIVMIEEELKVKTEHLNRIKEDLLPTAMREIGIEQITLTTGEKVTIQTGITASIAKKNQPAAFAWLKANQHDDLIKHEFKVKFGRGEEPAVEKVTAYLQKNGLNFSADRSVHGQTLKAFCKEQMERGVNLPHELFGIFEWTKSSVQRPSGLGKGGR